MNNPKNIILIFTFIVILTMLFSCKKSNTSNNSNSHNVDLAYLPTSTVESYITGRWRVHYMMGGICSTCKSDRDKYFEYYTFLPNRNIIYIYQNKVLSDTLYHWTTYKRSANDYVHNILVSHYGYFEFDKIMNDTLIVAVPFLGNPDFSRTFMTREP